MWRTIANIARGLGLDLLGSEADPDTVSSEAMLARLARGVSLEALHADGDIYIEAPATFGWVQSRLPLGRWNLAPAALVGQLVNVVRPAGLVVTPRRPTRRMNTQHYRDGDRPEALVHPDDARAGNVVDGELIQVGSRSGTLTIRARVTESVAPGTVSIQHGWEACNVNQLIDRNDLDPLTGMAHLSGTAVTIGPIPE
jgi:hypothetical protein